MKEIYDVSLEKSSNAVLEVMSHEGSSVDLPQFIRAVYILVTREFL